MSAKAEENSKTLENAARFASQKSMPRFTRFLDPAQSVEAARLAREYGVGFSGFGGYADAERQIGCFYPIGELPDESEYPLVCLCSSGMNRFATVSHRDILGAFMALGLTRACIGDIIISDTDIFLFAYAQNADFIASSLTSAGKMPLHFEALESIPNMPEPKGSTFSAVVSSLRLDAVAAAAYKLSRSEAAEAIRAGLLKLNHLPCEQTDAQVAEGAMLSLRGKGRVKLSAIGGLTKKQRIGITLFRYE